VRKKGGRVGKFSIATMIDRVARRGSSTARVLL